MSSTTLTHEHHPVPAESYQMEHSRWAAGRNTLFFIAVISVVACIAGYITNPDRFFLSYTVAFTFTTAVGLGAMFFIMAMFLAGSAANIPMRRIQENLMITIPVGAILFIPLAFGLKSVYPWTHQDIVNSERVLQLKSGFMSEHYFILRTYIYFLLFSIWAIAIYRQSTKQDTSRSIKQMYVIARWSAPGLLLVIVVGTLAAYDWLMSIQPSWYSTIFGLYYIAGGILTFMSIVILVCLAFRKAGILRETINMEHYHDLGKWLFCFTAFYTYIAFAQYLLIWYANIPAETQFYRARQINGWLPISLALPFLRFIIPFFVLLCRPAKRNLHIIGWVAAWSILMEMLDLYWVVMPTKFPGGPSISWMDFATLGATISICGLVFWNRFRRHKMVPVGDLRFEQGLHFENA